MGTIWIIAGKDLLLAWRDRLGFFWWMLGFPLLIAVFVGALFAHLAAGESPRVSFAVADLADTAASRDFLERLRRWGELEPRMMSLQAAETALRRGEVAACLILEPQFAINGHLLTGKPLAVRLRVDAGGGIGETVLRAALRETALLMLRDLWMDRLKALPEGLDSMPPTDSDVLLVVPTERVAVNRHRPASSFEVCFPLGMVWGLIGLAAELALAAVREHEEGTLRRVRSAPVAVWQIIAGRGLACFISAIGVLVMLLIVGRLAFGVRWQSPAALALAVPATAICFVGISLLLSTLGRSEASVAGGAWAVLLVLAMLGGAMVPEMFMPPWMERIGQVSPVRWAILALEGGIWRGSDWRDVLRPAGVLVGQGLIFVLLGAVLAGRSWVGRPGR